MGAHDAKDLIIGLAELLEEAGRKATFSVIAMDDELGDPADLSALVTPSAGKCIAGEGAIDSDAHIGAAGTGWQTLAPKPRPT